MHGSRARRLAASLASVWAQEGLGETLEVEPVVVDDGRDQDNVRLERHLPRSHMT